MQCNGGCLMLHGRSSRVRFIVGVLLAGAFLGIAIGQLASEPGETVRAAPLKQVVDTETPTPTNTDTPTPTATGTPTPSQTPRNNATSTLVAPANLVISEFRTRGPNGTNDEFIELFNPSGAAVNIGGWKIRESSGCGTTISNLITVATGVVIKPGGHFLVASDSSSLTITADQTFSTSIADDGGIALVDADGDVIDRVGMCLSTQYREGTPLTPLSGSSDQSYARNPIGVASGCYDVNNNAADFSLISPSSPQNISSPLAMCPGVVLSTPTSTPTRTPTRTPTSTITPIPGLVVINEFLPHPRSDWNGDGTANVGDEYIEIINLGVEAVSLLNWKLDNVAGSSSSYTLPDVILEPRAIASFFHADTGIALRDGGGTVRLLKPGGQIVDAYTYGVVEAADISWCRLPGGNVAWTFACRPTPGRPNARAESGYLTPTPSSAIGEGPAPEGCPLADTVPAGIVQAECGEARTAMWNRELWGEGQEFWLESRFKWGLFIH